MGILNIIGIIISSILVLFLPGFVISFIFFGKGKIEILERIALSFALSISIVPLTVFYCNLLGIKINAFSVLAEISIILLISVIILIFQKKIKLGK